MKIPKIFWLDVNRFDTCQFKIRSLSMMENLLNMGIPITYVTSYVEQAHPYPGFYYLKTLHSIRGIFRLSFYKEFFGFIKKYLSSGNKILLIVFPETLYFAVLIKLMGWLRRCKVYIHVDFRTVPVFSYSSIFFSYLKYLVEVPFFWYLPIFLNRFFVSSNSFITKRMMERTGIRRKPSCVWTSGVTDRLVSVKSPVYPPHPPGPFELLYLGSMTSNRGVLEILHAFAENQDRLGDFIFRIVGGDGLDNVADFVEKRNLGKIVQLEGLVQHDNVSAYLEKAHAFISPLPDHPWWEVSSPLKLFEYLATGKPIILTDIAPHKDIVPHDTPGILWLEDLSPQSIINSIFDLRKNYDQYLAGYMDRLNIASKYSWSNQGKKFGNFIKSQYLTNILSK